MTLHILGICGTFMGGVAALARELGLEVEGSDQNVYPPMSTQLEALGVALKSGYLPEHLAGNVTDVVIGNALSRGNPAVEAVLDAGTPYTSGAQWLAQNVLPGRTVLAVAGTHGKTTTSTLLAFLIDRLGGAPGFLIGGVPTDFGVSARLGHGACFVVEADEYDTAFFDKRSKFVHYRPNIAILNNLEYDHADIFPDLAAIERQFHHLIRTVPGNGQLIVNAEDENLARVLAQGCWTPVQTFGIDTQANWQARLDAADGSAFTVLHDGAQIGTVRWNLAGRHNVMNALAALAAAAAAGFDAAAALPLFAQFRGPKRRLELLAQHDGIHVYDDFAHHPTAIATTLAGLRARHPDSRLVAVLEPRSNSMRLGAHAAHLAPSLHDADVVAFLARPELPWDASRVIATLRGEGHADASVDALLQRLHDIVRAGDTVVFMSNGGFEGAPHRFVDALHAVAHPDRG
ncbi:UDP-N-acetylmuramate:L-alanyl-gamma-D-glutamyl-meso-diaminopimelate ligase [Xanthomonadaceae bacterium XH05]|nr:UDP-N-acetylmuramate:L-alanyl-gamma-D-glutamyl-meso-diaminopimelate ligase [Xanthomonadaceae bacterium XH05]